MNVVTGKNEKRTNECMEVEWKPPNLVRFTQSEKEKRRKRSRGEREKESVEMWARWLRYEE